MTSFQSEEHKEEDKIISPRDTENVINEVKEKEYQAADNQAIQQPDADQSDKSVIHKSDINMDMAEDVKEVGVTSSEPKEVSDNPLTDSVIQEAKPDPEEEPDLKTKTECTPLEEKTGGTVCFLTISFFIFIHHTLTQILYR